MSDKLKDEEIMNYMNKTYEDSHLRYKNMLEEYKIDETIYIIKGIKFKKIYTIEDGFPAGGWIYKRMEKQS